ncbi:MAG: HAMP domain-containing histidine kinase [Phycisphaeraceae bacterium]|nr:HAMP domain-containing histidine kinase [Phycisphaeraceae bacterium]
MIGFFRRSRSVGTGPEAHLWPVLALLVLMAVVPSACVLWFLSRAVGNERLAVRQRLVEVYRRQLSPAPELARQWWEDVRLRLTAEQSLPPAEVFGRLIEQPPLGAAVVLDAQGQPVYPQASTGFDDETSQGSPWDEVEQLKRHDGDLQAVLRMYKEMGDRMSASTSVAQARLSQARCLLRLYRPAEAIRLILDEIDRSPMRKTADSHGRLLAPNALLLGLEAAEPGSKESSVLLDRLLAWVDYRAVPAMPSQQRRFLLAELVARTNQPGLTRSLAAEQLAEHYLSIRRPTEGDGPSPSGVEGVWQITSDDHRVVGLIRQGRLTAELVAWLNQRLGLDETVLELLPPGTSPDPEALAWVAMQDALPGWQLALRIEGVSPFAAAEHRQEVVLIWAGILALTAIGAATAAAGYALQRQVRLARLKNDLIANVSHELKTPLAGMRVLIDTLVDGRCRNERQATEYLGLIARENTRLCRLIDNFLAFSRMERNKQAFVMEPVAVADVIDAAAQSVHERVEAAGGELTVEVDENLPAVTGDKDALTTAVLNLLDNALKYSGQDKRIHVRAMDLGLDVGIEVSDHGIGIPPRAQRRIFERFYQVDQRLSRSAGGCGLGLSVVRFIMTAHGGTVEMRSIEGKGSTFLLRLPKKNMMDPGQG